MFSLEFDWVFLHPGPGHVEMNMLKGITELCWDVFWKNLAQLMNFTSEKALLCCKRVSDHRKGWTLATIARDAISCELVLPFVREQLKKGDTNLSAVEFAKFLKNEVKDNTYAFLVDVVFEFLDSMFLYRDGVRNANPKFMFAGLAKFAKLWSGRKHPLYRELEMSFNVSIARLPEELQSS